MSLSRRLAPVFVSSHDATIEQREKVWMSGVDAIAALHRVPVGGFGFLGDTSERSVIGDRIAHWRDFGLALGADAEPTVQRGLDALERSAPECGPLAVHWGDAKPGNMIFRGGEAAAILDWELCGLGPGEEDLAHWMAVDWFLSTAISGSRLAGLPSPEETVARYEAAAGRPTIGMDWWFAFCLVRMGLVFQRAAVQSRLRSGGDDPLRPNVIAPHVDALLDGTTWNTYCRG